MSNGDSGQFGCAVLTAAAMVLVASWILIQSINENAERVATLEAIHAEQ